jgi:hypothetical protein
MSKPKQVHTTRSPAYQLCAALLFGLPLVAQNFIEPWAHGSAGFIYLMLAMAAAALLIVVIAALLLAWVSMRILNKRNASVSKLLRQLPGWLAGLMLAFCLAWITRPALGVGSDLEEFDSVRWRAEAADQTQFGSLAPRQRMLKDAIRTIQSAKSRAEIEALLGPSQETSYFKETGRHLIYRLGMERGAMAIDSEWLLIWLDESGKMVRYKLVTD